MAQINIKQIFFRAFGFYPSINTVNRVEPIDGVDAIDVLKSPNDDLIGPQPADYYSCFGTPIFFPLKIDGHLLPNEPLITVTGSKKIIKTVVSGLKGTVKEEIGLGDYNVNVKGVVINENSDEFPEDEVRKIKNLFEKPGALEVKSPFLALFGIDMIVLQRCTFSGIAGEQSQQAYQFNAISDRSVELVIKEGV